jgi:hypothetical protein
VRQFSFARLIRGGRSGFGSLERIAGNGMRFGKPGTQVDQAAAIAAEWPVGKLIGPLDRTLAGWTPQSLGHGTS